MNWKFWKKWKRKSYVYFVSYAHKNDSTFGNGSCSVTRNLKIKSYEDIVGISDSIREANNFNAVVIINFVLLEEE